MTMKTYIKAGAARVRLRLTRLRHRVVRLVAVTYIQGKDIRDTRRRIN